LTRQAAVIRFGLLLISILMAGVPARAEQKKVDLPQPPQNPIVAVKDYPWSAIGKLNNGASGSCTTFLISRQYALTAAHCLFFKPTGRFLPAQSLHLVFGFESGQFTEHLRVSSYHVPSAYDPLRPYETLASDWALLLISGEPSAATRPLDIEQHINPAKAPNLMAPGYAKQTPYRMTADRQCHFVGRSSDRGLLFDSCNVFEGYSGGPVLIQNPGKHSVSVAGIHVGNQVWQGRPIAVAISSEAIWREIKSCLMSKECKFQHVATGRDATAAEVLAGLSNSGDENRFELTSSPLCAANDSNCKPADQ
jgi:protease YdgD